MANPNNNPANNKSANQAKLQQEAAEQEEAEKKRKEEEEEEKKRKKAMLAAAVAAASNQTQASPNQDQRNKKAAEKEAEKKDQKITCKLTPSSIPKDDFLNQETLKKLNAVFDNEDNGLDYQAFQKLGENGYKATFKEGTLETKLENNNLTFNITGFENDKAALAKMIAEQAEIHLKKTGQPLPTIALEVNPPDPALLAELRKAFEDRGFNVIKTNEQAERESKNLDPKQQEKNLKDADARAQANTPVPTADQANNRSTSTTPTLTPKPPSSTTK